MNVLAADIVRLGQELALQAFIVFLRVGAMVSLVPAFGERLVPQRVRLAVAIAFTTIVLPAVPGLVSTPGDGVGLFGLILSETLIGLVLGLALRLMVVALQMAASMVAQSTSLAQLLGGAATEPMPAIGHLFVLGGLALAVLSDLHVALAAALIDSYRVFPAGHLPAAADVAEFGMAQVSYCFGLAFSLAAPFVVAALVYNLALGAINRAMPQLMVVLVGAPAITGAGLALVAVLTPFLLQIWLEAFEAVLANPFGVR